MAIFMVHTDLNIFPIEEFIKAQDENIKHHDNPNCRVLTYWFDREKKIAFTLYEAQSKGSVKSILDQRQKSCHQLIVQVNSSLEEIYCLKTKNCKEPGSNLPLYNPPASQEVLAAFYLNNFKNPIHLWNSKNNIQQLTDKHTSLKHIIKDHQGKLIKHKNKHFICVFKNGLKAIQCAMEIRRLFLHYSSEDYPCFLSKIALDITYPENEENNFSTFSFDKVKTLCFYSINNNLVISDGVTELLKNEGYFLNKHLRNIKILSTKEENFAHLFIDILNKKLNTHNLNLSDTAQELGVSKSNLYRTLVSITSLSPQNFIMEYKLNKALMSIDQGLKNTSEVAYEAGFSSPSYFTKSFKKRFGITPSSLYKS